MVGEGYYCLYMVSLKVMFEQRLEEVRSETCI